jgi:hypothetical protein
VSSAGSNPAAATPPGYPNQQRTPAQTRRVAGATPVPGTDGENDGRVAQRQRSRLISGRREVRLLPRPLRDPLARHAGSEPALRRFESVSRDHSATNARLAQRQRQPAQTRYGRSSNLRARTKRTSRRRSVTRLLTGRCGFESRRAQARSSTAEHQVRTPHHVSGVSRGGRRDGALSCTQSRAGLTPALSTIVNHHLLAAREARADG